MSIVPTTGVLRKLYEDARTNIEYKSSAFWQVYLQRAFYEDYYIVVCEFAPDSSKRRVDIVVQKYDENHHTLSSFLFHECKRPDGNVNEVEKQALSAAKLAIKKDNLDGVYVVTTIGTRFRSWHLPADENRLRALHGQSSADRTQYIDADSDWAYELTNAINLAKMKPPLRRAPTVPSQSLADLKDTGNDFGEDAPAEEWDASAEEWDAPVEEWDAPAEEWDAGGAPAAGLSMEGVEYGDYTSSFVPGEEAAVAGPSGSSSKKDDREVKFVKVSRKSHTLSPDEYVFKDRKSRMVSTTKDSWTEGRIEGQTVWFYKDKKMTYVSERKIGKDLPQL